MLLIRKARHLCITRHVITTWPSAGFCGVWLLCVFLYISFVICKKNSAAFVDVKFHESNL